MGGLKRGPAKGSAGAGGEKNKARRKTGEDAKAAWSEAVSEMTPHVERFRAWWQLISNFVVAHTRVPY